MGEIDINLNIESHVDPDSRSEMNRGLDNTELTEAIVKRESISSKEKKRKPAHINNLMDEDLVVEDLEEMNLYDNLILPSSKKGSRRKSKHRSSFLPHERRDSDEHIVIKPRGRFNDHKSKNKEASLRVQHLN